MNPSLQLPTLEATVAHSTAGLLQISIPWAVLLGGTPAEDEVRSDRLPLADYYRGRKLAAVVALDATNGLDRSTEDPALVAAGATITDPAVYGALREMVNADAGDLAAQGSSAKLLVSVQVETAWGGLQGGSFEGIAGDRADFPFIEALGLSSYPYLGGYVEPAAIPDDYFSRLVAGDPLPVLVLEGGWPSVTVNAVAGTPAMQADYIRRMDDLLGATEAAGWFQITFTDLDIAAWPAGLAPFAHNGLVDVDLEAKPALAAWSALLGR